MGFPSSSRIAGSTNHRPSGEIAPPSLRSSSVAEHGDPFTRPDVPDATFRRCLPVGVARSFPSGLKMAAFEARLGALEKAQELWVPLDRREHGASSLRAIAQPMRFDGQEQADVRVSFDYRPRLRGHPRDVGSVALIRRTSARHECQPRRRPRRRPTRSPCRRPTRGAGASIEPPPCDWRRGSPVPAATVRGGREPVRRRGQSRSTVELAGHPAERVPRRRR